MRRIFGIVISLLMIFAFSSMALAEDGIVKTNEPIVGISVENGIATPLTQSELDAFLTEREQQNKALLESMNKNSETVKVEMIDANGEIGINAATNTYTYTQTSSSTVFGNAIPVSAWVLMPSNGGSIESSISSTITRTYTAGLSTEKIGFIFNYIKANVNASIAVSGTNTVGYKLNGTPGFTQRMVFSPKLQISSGKLTTTTLIGHSYYSTTESVTSQHPVKNGSVVDGKYYLESK